MSDYYQILGVSHDATQDQIKKAYRKQAQTYHPDVNKTPEAESMMKQVNQAYDVLGDANKRAQYDQYRSNPYSQGQPFTGQQQRQYHSQEEMFEEMFRQFYQGQNTQNRQSRRVVINPIGFFFRVMFGWYIFNAIVNFIFRLIF